MPKATVAGASIADADGVCRTFEPLDVQHGGDEPPVVEGDYVEGGEQSSAGNSSSESTDKPVTNSTTSGEPLPPTAPTTESPSPQTQTDTFGVGSTSTSTTGSDETSPDDESDPAAHDDDES